MGWTSGDGVHEGWAAAQFPGGWFSVGSGGDGTSVGAMVRRFAPQRPLGGQRAGEPEIRDGREALGWRGLCECGWRGPLWVRVSWPEQADPDAYRVHVPDADRYGTAPPEVNEEIEEEWRAHAEPADALDEVARTAAAAAVADRRLTRAVRTALGCGASWAEVAAAAGVTFQAAYERWAPFFPAAGG
ncbi:hypothetical protein DP939_14400 [Spongiactinospora rosea]|uniref:Uncharacterized protein n=1 Tax=Spongiactinospora rosea TaxID=2248750 RepID=A0A366M141_9ACTN|nr:hypothetical protein [Spongiactinospora rosea]RBQ19142.1 hypothetical protein DP939_14400 [Spongiactinospora rosea]